MYKNLELLNKINHKTKSIKVVENFLFAKKQINVPITIAEFFEACKNYPIFFTKDKDNTWFASVMLGYKENENIFVDEKGNWEKLHYIPAFVRRYPFVFVTQDNKDEVLLALDKEYLIDSKNNEQRKLFNEDKNSEFLNSVLNFLNKFNNDSKITTNFIKQLDEWELLEEKTATITISNKEQYNLKGLFIVNEEKLKHLSKKRKEELCSKDMIPLITAHLISLSNIQKLGIK